MAGAAVVCAAVTELCPKGQVKSVLKALCGLVMAAVLVSPLTKLDFTQYSLSMAKYRSQAETLMDEAEESRKTLSRRSIEAECRAYILDKAQLVGAAVTDAEVDVKWSDEGVWYPVSARISGAYSERLASAIEAELGVGRASQEWNDENA